MGGADASQADKVDSWGVRVTLRQEKVPRRAVRGAQRGQRPDKGDFWDTKISQQKKAKTSKPRASA